MTLAAKASSADVHLADVLPVFREGIKRTSALRSIESPQIRNPAGDTLASVYSEVIKTLPEHDPLLVAELREIQKTILESQQAHQLSPLTKTYVSLLKKGGTDKSQAGAVMRVLHDEISRVDDVIKIDLARAYVSVIEFVEDADPILDKELTAIRDDLMKAVRLNIQAALATVYGALLKKRNQLVEVNIETMDKLRKMIFNRVTFGLAVQAYADIVSAARLSNSRLSDELASVRLEISKAPEYTSNELAGAYVALIKRIDEADPRIETELLLLRNAMISSKFISELGEAYVGLVVSLKNREKIAKERAALRNVILATHDSEKVSILIKCYSILIGIGESSPTLLEDIKLILSKMSDLRKAQQYESVADNAETVVELGRTTLSSDQIGLIYAAMLLQPISGDYSNSHIASGYENFLRKRGDKRVAGLNWRGDVWAFATWARNNLPQFDEHEPR